MDIIKTHDYNKFRFFENNRPINKNHVKKLQKSIENVGLIDPIKCSKIGLYYFIADGQHRFKALRNLNEEVNALVNIQFDSQSVLPMNTYSKNWNVVDYVNRYAAEGVETYQKLLELYKEHETYFKPATINDAFNNVQSRSLALIKEKKYILNEEIGKRVLEASIACYNTNFKKEFVGVKFVRAIKQVIAKNNEDFKLDVLLKKIQKKKIIIYNNEKDIVTEIKECYNYNNKKHRIA